MRTIRPTSVPVSAIALVTLLATSGLGAASVADIVRKYGLTGTWAPDCTKPPDRTNPHVVYTLLDSGSLQRETKIAPDKNFDVSTALAIVEISAGELLMAWKNQRGRNHQSRSRLPGSNASAGFDPRQRREAGGEWTTPPRQFGSSDIQQVLLDKWAYWPEGHPASEAVDDRRSQRASMKGRRVTPPANPPYALIAENLLAVLEPPTGQCVLLDLDFEFGRRSRWVS